MMKAIMLNGPGQAFTAGEIPIPVPGVGEVLIQVMAAAINHRDIWIMQGNYPHVAYPAIMGSDGAGTIIDTGEAVDTSFIGKEVLINPSLGWGDTRAGQGPHFHILGVPTQGTFADYVCVPASNVYAIPEGYDYIRAAALPLAGLTAHRALFYRGDLQPGQTILITGIGGGVAVFALGFAVRVGAKVLVTSSSDEKIAKAMQLGADGGVNYTGNRWNEQLRDMTPNGFDLIIDGAGGPNVAALIGLLKTGGKIVNYGRTAGPFPEMSPAILFYKQASMLGTTMGSPADFESMLEFIAEYNMRPTIDSVFELQNIQEAFSHIMHNAHFGKVVLRKSKK